VAAVAQLGGVGKGVYLVDLSPTFAEGGVSAGWTCAATPTAPTHELAANHLVREHPENVRGTFREYSVNIQGTLNEVGP
jgi:hypothetical protein